MKKAVLLVAMMTMVASVTWAQVTAVIGNDKLTGSDFKELTANALQTHPIKDTVAGVGGAGASLQEIIAGAIVAKQDLAAVFSTMLSLNIDVCQAIKASVKAGVAQPDAASAAKAAGVGQAEVAKCLGLQTPGLAYTPAQAVQNVMPSAARSLAGTPSGGFVSPSGR